jgi:ElaB/YqjD/DUF883 family membrane-anchored ribosome-binding protein
MNDTTQNSTPAQPTACASASLNESIQKLRTLFDDLQGNAVHKARGVARSTDQVVHIHPYGAIGIAAVVGLIVGFIVTRR